MLNGQRVKQIIMMFILVAIYSTYTFGAPYYAAYSARPIVRRACTDQIQEDRRKGAPRFVSVWKNRFMSSLRSVGIFVESEQYAFRIEKSPAGRRSKYECQGQMKFALDNKWIPDFEMFESPTFRTVHTVDETVNYRE